jgi:hypothetical protein
MLRPMILLALSVAVLDDHTRLACLETNDAPLLLATLGTGIDNLVHTGLLIEGVDWERDDGQTHTRST